MSDIVDMALLRQLRQNSRQHLTRIGEEFGVPVTTLVGSLKRIKEKFGVKCTTIVDFKPLGHSIRVSFALQAKRKQKQKLLEDFLLASPNTNNVFRLSEDYDYLADALFRNVAELYSFEEELRSFGLSKLEEIHFIDEIECEKFLP